MITSRCEKGPFPFLAESCSHHAHRTHGRCQSGISLVESLVALLLISIALLGIAGLQLTTLQDTRDARWRIEAVSLASGALERMRASREDADAFEIDADDQTIAACAGGDTAICNGMKAWLSEVDRLLPNALAAIAVDTVDDLEHVTVSLRWRQRPPVESEDEGESDPLPKCGADAASGGCVMLETRL
nr:type IV pilus modification protein PilV [uncultured Halomonas sp.]